MKRPLWGLALLVAAAACGGETENVVVLASLGPEGTQPVADLPVRLLPYDRRAILDSLGAEDESPLPRYPEGALEQLRMLQAEAARVKPRGDTAVARVEARRRALVAQLAAIRTARARWLEERREDFEAAVKERTNRTGFTEQSDTTDARGRAGFAVDPGRWYAVSRYVLPDAVLEWQVRLNAESTDSSMVRLTRQNAREEPFF
ncbi:MAG TPA: hypothetical protein VEX86_03110 [Longimicrobium sp.]|nr:hypothetical protein [Longimicrobium sp.]